MKIDVVSTDGFAPKFSQKFFLDSNVWMYLYFPQHSTVSQRIIRNYSALLEAILKRNGMIQTNLIQMSELINLIIQLEFRACRKTKADLQFKDFRESEAGSVALSHAKLLTSQILKTADLLSGTFSSDDMKKMVEQCDKADFNDIFFARFCEQQHLTLVTHDFDFSAIAGSIPVVSANARYLS